MKTLRARFESHCEPEPNSGCLLWDGALKNGYGEIRARLDSGAYAVLYAHRLAWEFAHGDIPKGLMVLHRCDVKSCCNPDHLFLGTHVDNANDMAMKNRGRSSALGLPYGVAVSGEKFTAGVHVNGRRHHLGSFVTAELAGQAALEGKARLRVARSV